MATSRNGSRPSTVPSVVPPGSPIQKIEMDGGRTAPAAMVGTMVRAKFPVQSIRCPTRLPQEPDDARMTGGTRSLSRRLLGLNIPSVSMVQLPVVATSRASSVERPRIRKSISPNRDFLAQNA